MASSRAMKAARALSTLFLVALAGVSLVWVAGSVVARPVNRPVPPPPPPGQVVHMRAADGVGIEGSYWPGARPDGPAVLLLHGINTNRNQFTRHAQWLSGLGYTVLAIDLRGHGGSGAVERTFGLHEARDAAAGFTFLERQAPGRRIGVIGVSLGGAAALLGEEGPLPAQAMVLHGVYTDIRKAIVNRLERSGSTYLASASEPLLSYQAYARYGVPPERIAPVDGIRRYRGTVLIVAGTDDDATRVEDSRALYDAAAGPKALWLVEGADHVETSKLFTRAYRERVRDLFARTLGEPGGHRRPPRPFES
jgi:dipeptidyl aminopeptidase/acylaminoacyl peptidase